MKTLRRFRVIALGLALALIIGCRSTSVEYRYLTLAQDSTLSPIPVAERLAGSRIGLGPVAFPGYLDRAHLMTLRRAHILVLSERWRWAEPLREAFTRVLLNDMARLLPSVQFVSHPWSQDRAPKLSLRLEIDGFQPEQSGLARLDARWEWNTAGFPQGSASFTQKVAVESEESVAAGLSACVAELSRRLAAELAGFHPGDGRP